ncbi:peptide chain release factor N(5)-glutamine methyltransferase [Clostridium sp. NSJ-145]|uniref:peptide chain release factor N(5)-glutamine methyltransferase n=1 Tax=Clostridium sp. NSJ-145 TaxID=2897777 RepID=UPI001E61F6CE|nr:peptide chain release factor N(5)-glutamine methyltransferase [Clostridium sp. NSJ-145]MCD2501485.1 peptide chain release factor N(5)-glutamine methyltransferase [Clostridium sp. NSJ-145]
MRKCDVGGQAVIEGVMMRGSKGLATAVRTPSGKIEVDMKSVKPLTKRYKFLNIPFIRGIFILIDSLIVGIKTLNYSASFFEEDEEESKFELWLKKKLGDKGANDLIVTGTMMFSLLLSVGLFVGIPTVLASIFKSFGLHPIALNLIESVIRVGILILYMYLVSKLDDIYRVFQYHGAEHKTIFCYENEEKLTVENVKRYSRFHPRCGTNFLFLTMFVSIIVFSLTGWGGIIQRIVLRVLLMPFVAGITYELIKWLGKTDSKLGKIIAYPGLKLQELTTKEPDDSQIEVAIASLLAAEGIEYKKKIGELLQEGSSILKEAAVDTYMLDSQLLLGKVINKDKLYLITNRDKEISKKNEKEYFELIEKRKNKMPIKYILKSAEFMGLDFNVEEGVLIPRPDTEILVEETLKYIPQDESMNVCDLCCGSGAIGIALASFRKNINIDLIDYYDTPMKVTESNIVKHNLKDRAKFVKSDLLKVVINQNKKYKILVSNPPYIKDEVIPTLMDDVKDYEPHTALSGGEDGLIFYRRIIDESSKVLEDDGILAFEIGHDQGEEVKKLMINSGYSDVRIVKDLAGLDRVVIGTLKS